MGKIFCMGDIHGFYEAFYERLDQLGNLHTVLDAGAQDRLVLLGDYIDGGPDSFKVLDLIRGLQSACPERVIVLRGNHEEMLLDWLDTYAGPHAGEPDEDGLIPWNSWLDTDPDFQTFRTLVSQAQWDFFRKALPSMSETAANMEAARMVLAANRELISWLRELPYYYETPAQIFVHAGVDEEAGEDWKWGASEEMLLNQWPAQTGKFVKDVVAGHIATSTISGRRNFHGIFWDGASHYYCDGNTAVSGKIPVLVYDEADGTYRSLDDDPAPEHRDRSSRRQIRGELRPIEKMDSSE